MSTEPKSRKGIGGPKTKEGKEKIRLNALKMGLHANTLEGMQAVSDVIEVDFEEIRQQMRGYYRPHDAMEDALVHRIARCLWNLRVIETMQDYLLRGMMVRSAPGASLESLSVIERRTDVQLHRLIQAMTTKRKLDRENMKNKLADLPPPGKWPRPQADSEEAEAPRAQEAGPQAVADQDQTRHQEPNEAQGLDVGSCKQAAPDARPADEVPDVVSQPSAMSQQPSASPKDTAHSTCK